MSQSLEGTWHPLKAELGGEAAPHLALERIELILQADSYTVQFAGETHDQGRYEHTLPAGDAHAGLLLTGLRGTNAGRAIPAIYQLAGDRLRICYGLDGVRPTGFITAGQSARYTVIYRRHVASAS